MAKQKQDEAPNSTEWFGVVVVLFAFLVAFVVWFYFRKAIVLPAFAVDYAIIWVIEHTKGIGQNGLMYKEFIVQFFNGTRDPSTDIQWGQFYQVRDAVGRQAFWVSSGIICVFAFHVLMKMKGNGFRRVFQLADNIQKQKGKKGVKPSFALYQAEEWKVASYAAQFDPDGADKNVLPAMTPLEWLVHINAKFENGTFDPDSEQAIVDAYKSQLGNQWSGLERANIHVQTTLILCAIHYLGSMEEYRRYEKLSLSERAALNVAWAGSKDGTEASKALVAKYKDIPEIRKVIEHFSKQHAYENTVVFRMLKEARTKSGIFKDADIGYIKRYDRALWYTLNNCGRHSYHIEAQAVVNHFKAEIVSRQALLDVRYEEAVIGLKTYLTNQGIYSLSEALMTEKIV